MKDFGNVRKEFNILSQPTDVSCGPTCLHAVYEFYGDSLSLEKVINDVKQVRGGGTLAVMLGNHALKRGYKATIYTYNLQIFDPSWFNPTTDISSKLLEQLSYTPAKKIKQATKAYLEFLSMEGKIVFEELSPALIRGILNRQVPILTGLSSTYLYQEPREIPETNQHHDTRGYPVGHFVVISDYEPHEKLVHIADPLNPNPINKASQYYQVKIQRLINAILLGIVTYDANLLVIEPK